MSDFQIALLIFLGLVIIGFILGMVWNDTIETIFNIIGCIFGMIWSLFWLLVWCGFVILIITIIVHIYRMDL